jgi:hypothetical protein
LANSSDLYNTASGNSDMNIIKDRPWLLALIMMTFLAVPGFLRVEYINDRTDRIVECITDWSDVVSRRSNALTEANTNRSNALDAVIRAAASQNRQLLVNSINDYIVVSDEYFITLKEHPVPESPKFNCQ